jgi:hypothetical protein
MYLSSDKIQPAFGLNYRKKLKIFDMFTIAQTISTSIRTEVSKKNWHYKKNAKRIQPAIGLDHLVSIYRLVFPKILHDGSDNSVSVRSELYGNPVSAKWEK